MERNVAIVKIEIAVTLVQADNIGLVESFNDSSLAILRNLSSNLLPKVEIITLGADLKFQRVFDQLVSSLASLTFDKVASESLDLRLRQVVFALSLTSFSVRNLTFGGILEAQEVDCLVLFAEKDDPRLFEAMLLNVAQRVRQNSAVGLRILQDELHARLRFHCAVARATVLVSLHGSAHVIHDHGFRGLNASVPIVVTEGNRHEVLVDDALRVELTNEVPVVFFADTRGLVEEGAIFTVKDVNVLAALALALVIVAPLEAAKFLVR